MRRVETVIVGGGPAGAATACGLAAMGREVVLLERAGAPHHKVCGEFLSIETQAHLLRLGVDAAALGAVPIEQVTLRSPTRSVSAELPFRGLSLSRYRLDAALLRSAQRRGAEVKLGVAATSVAPAGDDGWIVQCGAGEALHCRNLVYATGKTGVRGIPDARDGAMVGLKMHLRLSAGGHRALAGRVELSFFDRGYAGLELVEGGIANLCCLLPREAIARIGSRWPTLADHLVAAMPSLAERLRDAEPLWARPLAAVCPAGGHRHRSAGPAVYRVGDRLAHIPPFTGDGLGIALTSAALAAKHIRDGLPAAAYQAAADGVVAGAVRLAGLLSGLAGSPRSRPVLMGAAALAPGLVGVIARYTRMPRIIADFYPASQEPADSRLANAGSKR